MALMIELGAKQLPKQIIEPAPIQPILKPIEAYKKTALDLGFYAAVMRFESELLAAIEYKSISDLGRKLSLKRTTISTKLQKLGLPAANVVPVKVDET